MNKYLVGTHVLGAMPGEMPMTTNAAALSQAPTLPRLPPPKGSGTSWWTIGGIALAAVATVVLGPHLLKD